MSAKTTFGRNLRYLRNLSALSVKQVAEDLDVDRTRYSVWERGRSVPDYDMLVGVSNYFGASIDDMLKLNMAANALAAIRAGVKPLQG